MINNKLDLETLKHIKFMFGLHSDHSTSCYGYQDLCRTIDEIEKSKIVLNTIENNYLNHVLKLLKFTDTKINSCEISDTEAKIKMQYYQWEEEIIIDFTTPSNEGELGHDVSCYYKKFNQPNATPIGYHQLLKEIFELTLEI